MASPDRAAPMAAAPFVWREDGRPDWQSMWTSFCDLALHGGPPHRGIEQALRGPETTEAGSPPDAASVAEIQRGIRETTGLAAEPWAPGWIAVACRSRAMAEWLAAAIVLENVEARVEDDHLLLPAGPRFRLEDEVKSIVTVVAKTHHYWAIHGGGRAGRPLTIGIGGPGDGKTVLIEALRRRYGRRRAVVASLAQPPATVDHAVDLVLVELGDEIGAPGSGLDEVDATIGVFDAAAAAGALGRGDRGLDAWHLLVIRVAGETRADLARLEHDAGRLRGAHPMVLADLATPEGVDGVTSWLQREMSLDPWRERSVGRTAPERRASAEP